MRCHRRFVADTSVVLQPPTISTSTSISTLTASITIRVHRIERQKRASLAFQLRPSQAGFQCRLETVV